MTTLTRGPATLPLDLQLRSAFQAAFNGFSNTLGAQVSAVVAQQLARQAASKSIEKKVAAAMPALFEQAFIADFLQDKDSAHHRRVILAHLLSTAELQKFTSSNLEVSLAPSSDAAFNEIDELTSEQAAKLLHVSRTHLNTLVDTGLLGEVCRTVGRHRRISKAAVLQYKAASKKRQAKGWDAMAQASERLGLYDQELDGVPVRAKK
jgi:excisionase family DNA binding protein